jgi:dTDP-4-dehydrorhamnose 3,5-epimerase
MQVRAIGTTLPGVLLIEVDGVRDGRGFFMEVFHAEHWEAAGLPTRWVQDNHSRSRAGVLRGIHWQDDSAPMAKLVRCTRGSILDVAVDLRAGSPSFGRWHGQRLSEGDGRQLLIPQGFGHAFLALEPITEVQYKCSGPYRPDAEGAIRWDDPDLGIDWPWTDPIVSPRDAAAMSFAEYRSSPAFRHP